jgi:hypothetical protein
MNKLPLCREQRTATRVAQPSSCTPVRTAGTHLRNPDNDPCRASHIHRHMRRIYRRTDRKAAKRIRHPCSSTEPLQRTPMRTAGPAQYNAPSPSRLPHEGILLHNVHILPRMPGMPRYSRPFVRGSFSKNWFILSNEILSLFLNNDADGEYSGVTRHSQLPCVCIS